MLPELTDLNANC